MLMAGQTVKVGTETGVLVRENDSGAWQVELCDGQKVWRASRELEPTAAPASAKHDGGMQDAGVRLMNGNHDSGAHGMPAFMPPPLPAAMRPKLPTGQMPAPDPAINQFDAPSMRLRGHFRKASGLRIHKSLRTAVPQGLQEKLLWKNRYFVYDPDTNLLLYYASETDASCALALGCPGHKARGCRKVSSLSYDGDRKLTFKCIKGEGSRDADVVAIAPTASECARWADSGPTI